jgi:hypothetical protein
MTSLSIFSRHSALLRKVYAQTRTRARTHTHMHTGNHSPAMTTIWYLQLFTKCLTQVRYILSDAEGPQLDSPSLFTQFDVLVHFDDGTAGWKEISRYVVHARPSHPVSIGSRCNRTTQQTKRQLFLQKKKKKKLSEQTDRQLLHF